jgi:hypothetical protein
MSLSGRRWPVAIASGILCAAASGAARADPFFDPINAIDRPLTLPAHELGILGAGAARHLETGEVIAVSSLGAAYGVTDRFELSVSALDVEYTPATRILGPSGAATYAIWDRGAEIGVRFSVGGVVAPHPGAALQPSLPIRIAFGTRVRLDLGPEIPILVNAHPIVGVVAPFGVTVRLSDLAFAHLDTAAALYDVTARSMVIPAKLSLEFGIHVKKVPLSFTPFFAFPTLFTPGDERPHVHPKDYAGGLGLGTWFHL